MEKKKNIATAFLTLFFIVGMILIIMDMANNISLEFSNNQKFSSGYLETNFGNDPSPVIQILPTPTINPILLDTNQ